MLMMGLLLVNILIAIFSEGEFFVNYRLIYFFRSAWVATIENRAQVATQNLLDVIIEVTGTEIICLEFMSHFLSP